MDRKLASIQRISKIEPIPNADKIERLTILGWQLVSQKGTFKEGDLCVYFEVDSVLPEKPEFEFLRKSCWVNNEIVKGFRIKTVKLRGQISQGLALPMSILPSGFCQPYIAGIVIMYDIMEGTDVTETLGVVKYEVPIPACLGGKIKGHRPEFVPKTDEMRIQSVPGVLERHKEKLFYVSEKLDGTSGSFYYNNGEFGVCSRNLDILECESNTFWRVARKYNLKEKLSNEIKDQPRENIVFQGEVIGPGIQGNKYTLKEPDLYIFNVFDIDEGIYLNYIEAKSYVELLGLKFVPVLYTGYINSTVFTVPTIDEMVELSKGPSLLNPEIPREGIVLRPLVEGVDEELGRLSFKVVNPDFLLKYGE